MSTSNVSVASAGLDGGLGGALTALKSELGFTGALLGVFGNRQIECEGVLAAIGVDASRLKAWCDEAGSKDASWKEARRNGFAHARRAESRAPLRGEHLVTAALPASLDGSRYWYLAVARGRELGRDEELTIRLALRRVQVAMDHVGERGMGRLLVGRDERLLHADPTTQVAMLRDEGALGQLLVELHPVIDQRWGPLTPGEMHDVVIGLPQQGPTWVRFGRKVPAAGLPGHLYLELRRAQPDDPVVVGVMPDDRLAKAMAFLMDRFAEAPSLEQIAEVAHISPFHFHRLFAKAAGMSPKHYVLRTQLMIAKQQLRATHRPISDIATATGFASHGHFTATFHRSVGLSPTAYREREGGEA